MTAVRLIGDVHGKYQPYLYLIEGCEASIQVGDLGFNYNFLKNVDPTKHLVIPGNHDNYDIIGHKIDSRPIGYDHFLHGFGSYFLNELQFFYTSGAFSIDWYQRLQNERNGEARSWWRDEELSINELRGAIQYYKITKPDVVITHDAPKIVSDHCNDGGVLKRFGYHPSTFITNTQTALNLMYEAYQPKLWVFGHYHKSLDIKIGETRFKCLAELEAFDYETK